MSALSPRVCVVSHHASVAVLLADAEFAQLAQDPAFLLELRFDRYHDAEPAAVSTVLEKFGPTQCVVTCRSLEEGGGGCVAEADRLDYLRAAAQVGAAYVDVELATWQRQRAAGDSLRQACQPGRLIASAHAFLGVPERATLQGWRRDAEALGADVVKLAVQPRTLYDGWPLLQLLQEETPWRRPLLGLAMGEAGLWSRVLAPRFAHAAPFTFARAAGAEGTAPGQPTWQELVYLYRFARQDPCGPVYGVIGDPIAHSLSPRVHNTALQVLGLPGIYLPWRLEGDPLPFVRDWSAALGVTGLSVTLPHKEAVLSACRVLSPLAQAIGAVNTLTQPQQGTWVGDNTDAAAALACLQAGLGAPMRNRKVLVLGAGGVARAVAHAARSAGAQVFIANRTAARARQLAQAVGAQVLDIAALASGVPHLDAVVNATSVGMAPDADQSPLAAASIPPQALIFDTIYAPPQTQLLRQAAARGCRTQNGTQMFIAQAAAQFELFTGCKAPVETMQAALL